MIPRIALCHGNSSPVYRDTTLRLDPATDLRCCGSRGNDLPSRADRFRRAQTQTKRWRPDRHPRQDHDDPYNIEAPRPKTRVDSRLLNDWGWQRLPGFDNLGRDPRRFFDLATDLLPGMTVPINFHDRAGLGQWFRRNHAHGTHGYPGDVIVSPVNEE